MPSTRSTIGDFSILPISIPPLPSFPKPTTHHLYLRRNAPKIPTPDDSRSLFIINAPADSTRLHFRALFTALLGAGRFESVTFEDERKAASQALADLLIPAQAARLASHSKKRKREEDEDAQHAREEETARLPEPWSRPLRRSGGTAVVVLADEKSVEKALKAVAKAAKTGKYPVWGAGGVPEQDRTLGSSWIRSHVRLTYPDKAAAEAAVDAFFTVYNRREREAAELAKRLRSEPDEDGFVTVTRGGGRTAPAKREEAEEARRKMVEKAEKKREELSNFYRFQLRERKKEEQAELVKKFEEDRRRVEAMREKRGKFRPES
ncbi:Ribosomal RNA-processing protein 7 [Coniochaeta hoffmannii]|uniref:Ribosomal RNA-processing protein 7 n=1 Tax=Coniochaeta hoffmannii TaxID=91930 RepID=A0AA38VTA5_9PEZI|nr:Ribosomal RNA-processing protein 7 [Coniochaeta hoffmannii]